MFGTMPAYGFFIRHVKGLEMDHMDVSYAKDGCAHPSCSTTWRALTFDHVKARRPPDVPFFVLHNVSEFTLHNCPGLDRREPGSSRTRVFLTGRYDRVWPLRNAASSCSMSLGSAAVHVIRVSTFSGWSKVRISACSAWRGKSMRAALGASP